MNSRFVGSPSGRRSTRIAALLLVAWLTAPAAGEAGVIYVWHQDPSVHWAISSSRDRIVVYFREDDWHDTCPPELQGVTIDAFEIAIRFALDPDSGCVPDPAHTPYAKSVPVGRLPAGDYTATVEAPDFATGEIEQTTATFEVVEAVQCGLVQAPAATVLLPYFEVDLDDLGGRTTLFSVGSAAREPVLAHAVLWTNWGNPALSFDFFVPADGVATFNLQQVLLGELAPTSPPPDPPAGWYEGCTDPVTLPEVDAQELRAILTGQPHPQDGLCHSSAVEDGRLATGYVTVDVVRDCSGAELRTPHDPGYFEDGGTGLATNDNALTGDFFLIDLAGDFAQGETLVPIVADAERVGYLSFYRQDDNRMPLPAATRSRFLGGGPLMLRTELLVWMEGRRDPIECGQDPFDGGDQIKAEWRSEQADQPGTESFIVDEHTLRLEVGGDLLPTGPGFGTIDVGAIHFQSVPGPPVSWLLQTWTMPITSADGRFSVGLGGDVIEDFCR